MGRQQDPIHTKHPAIGLVAKVPSIGEIAVAGLRIGRPECLIHPVPYCTAHEEVGALDRLPVVDEVAHRIAHTVGILADVEGVLQIILPLYRLPHPGDGGVLIGAYVDDVVIPLVLHRARLVKGLDRIVSGDEALPRPRLIAERPDQDRGLIDMRSHHIHRPLDRRIGKFRHVRQRCFAVVVGVALAIGLILKVEPKEVAEVVEYRSIGIVREADVIDIPPLHQHDLVDHLLSRDRITGLGVDLLAIDPLELDRLPIEVKVAPSEAKFILLCGRIADLNFPKSRDHREGLSHSPARVKELAHQRVEVRSLRRPEVGIAEGEGRLGDGGLAPWCAGEVGRHDDAGMAILLAVELVTI